MQSINLPTTHGLRLLVLDDGGTRGLSELLIIQELMNRIKYITNASVSPKPCEYFDMIGGVGTGGLIALMLGRLKMPIDQAIKEYVTLCSRVFSDKKWQGRNEKFRASVFEASIEAIIKSSGLLPNALLRDDGSQGFDNCLNSSWYVFYQFLACFRRDAIHYSITVAHMYRA
ncbi:hypothetical protein C0993_002100 [Termitomyces sp. T159_Od127]|nr:hypothetical protein C0993_002100 [Termitomyces sp. T159_Od127]